ncbi:cystathionine gamma-synthase [Tylopilus felleus]
MSTSVAVGSETLGLPIPPFTQHAIINSLPTWRDNVDFRNREKRVMDSLVTGYPRFVIHLSVKKLTNICEQKFAVNGEKCMLYPSNQGAEECRHFILNRAALSGTPASVRLVQYSVSSEEDSCARANQRAELHIALFPENLSPIATEFWRYTGLGISSRFAEHCLSLLPGQDKQDPESPRGASQPSSAIFHAMSRYKSDYAEERDPPLSAGACAKQVLRRRIAGLLTSGNVQDESQGHCTGTQDIEIESHDRGHQGVSEHDVFLFPTGMVAIWNAHQLCLRARPPAKSVCFGFLNIDTLKVLEGWGPGVHFFGHGHDSDIDALERLLTEESSRDPIKPPILALFTEVTSNPLLRSADMPRLRTLADTYSFPLIMDDSIGNSVDTEILPYADIVVTSLSKIFSGAANVMGGSLVLNPKGRHYAALKSHMDTYEDTYFDKDALVMEYNSRDLAERVQTINANAEALCAFLRTRSAEEGAPSAVIKEVFYPKYTTPTNYLRCKRPAGGYGGLFSLTFTSLAASIAFYDALPCHKGPSLGTNFTLACAFALLAFHDESEWAAQYGVEEGSVRISVGMEDRDWLFRSFDAALKAAESAQ